MAEEIDVIDEDEIGLALSTAWETIDDYCDQPLYRDPAVAAWIQSVRDQMEALQMYLTALAEAQESERRKPRRDVSPAYAEAPDDGTELVPGRRDGPKLPRAREPE